MLSTKIKTTLLSLSAIVLLSACGGGNDTLGILPAEYEIKVENMTNFQPLSPVGFTLDPEAEFFMAGEEASIALEKLSEGGDNSELLANARESASTSGVLLPGQSEIVRIKKGFGVMKFSSFSMLVNTNDAFTGINAYDLSALKVDETVSINTVAYDAGTEKNSEEAGTIPGPADGGEGFNEVRDDLNVVTAHRGVVSKDDGLESSVLSEQHKFDNPVMRVTVRRIK